MWSPWDYDVNCQVLSRLLLAHSRFNHNHIYLFNLNHNINSKWSTASQSGWFNMISSELWFPTWWGQQVEQVGIVLGHVVVWANWHLQKAKRVMNKLSNKKMPSKFPKHIPSIEIQVQPDCQLLFKTYDFTAAPLASTLTQEKYSQFIHEYSWYSWGGIKLNIEIYEHVSWFAAPRSPLLNTHICGHAQNRSKQII